MENRLVRTTADLKGTLLTYTTALRLEVAASV